MNFPAKNVQNYVQNVYNPPHNPICQWLFDIFNTFLDKFLKFKKYTICCTYFTNYTKRKSFFQKKINVRC